MRIPRPRNGNHPPRSRSRSTLPGLRHLRWPAPLALALIVVSSGAAIAELTVSGNLRLREDDFDLMAFEAQNYFGWALATCDFDGDGYQDLAIGSPNADFLGVIDDVGQVHVAYGSADGLTLLGHQTLTQPHEGPDPPEEDDHFGESLAGGDFNGDGFCDLAAGTPDEEVDAVSRAGSVHVFYGTASGLATSSQVWTQNTPGVSSSAEVNEAFGSYLAAGDFDNDTHDDLAISARGEDSGGGAVHILFGTEEGLTSFGDDFIYQGDPLGTDGVSESLDGFGWALAVGDFDNDDYADLAVGVPFEDFGAILNLGWVHVFYGSASGFFDRDEESFDQASFGHALEDGDNFGWSLAAGDFDGAGRDDLAIGSPGEGVGLPGLEDGRAGSVTILTGTVAGLSTQGAQVWTQDSAGVSDEAEPGDEFGSAVAAGDFDGDGRDDLGVGVIMEDFPGGGLNVGAVHALYGSHAGLTAERERSRAQGGWNLGNAEDNDYFGSPLAAGDFDGDGVWALAVGVPFENLSGEIDTGLVGVITAQLFFADGFESGDLSAWSAAVP